MSKRQQEIDKAAEREYKRERDFYESMKNTPNRERAEELAQENVLDCYEDWLKHYSDCDIIVQAGEDLDKYIPTDNRIKKGNILYDARYLYATKSYDITRVCMGYKKEDTDGSGSGYTISETSDGYSVSSNYTPKYEEVKYVYTEEDTEVAYAALVVKAVKSGTADLVIQNERELAENFHEYTKAKKYKANPKACFTESTGKVKAYNILCLVATIGVFLCLILFELAIFSKSPLFECSVSGEPNISELLLERVIIEQTLKKGMTAMQLPLNSHLVLFIGIVLTGILLIAMGTIADKITNIKCNDARNRGDYDYNYDAFDLTKLDKRSERAWLSYLLIVASYLICLLAKSFLVEVLTSLLLPISFIILNVGRVVSLFICVIQLIIAFIKLNSNPFVANEQQEKSAILSFLHSDKFQNCQRLEKEIKSCTIFRKDNLAIDANEIEYMNYGYFMDYNRASTKKQRIPLNERKIYK